MSRFIVSRIGIEAAHVHVAKSRCPDDARIDGLPLVWYRYSRKGVYMKPSALLVCLAMAMVPLSGALGRDEQPSSLSITSAWTSIWGSALNDGAYGVCTDDEGAVYVAGYVQGSVDGEPFAGEEDLCLTKYAADGKRLWTQVWGSTSYDQALDVVADDSGNVYVCGYTWGDMDNYTNQGASDFVLSKFTSSGSNVWTRVWGSSSLDQGTGVAFDSQGGVYVSGYAKGTIDGHTPVGKKDLCLTRFNDVGTSLWVRIWGSTEDDYGQDVVGDGAGNVYVAGYTYAAFDDQSFAGSRDACLSKYDSTGVRHWTRLFGCSGIDQAEDVVIGHDGKIYVTGYGGAFGGQQGVGGTDPFLCAFTTAGAPDSTRIWGSTGDDAAYGLGKAPDGTLFVAGICSWMNSFDGQPNHHSSFLTRFSAGGAREWSLAWGEGNGEAQALAVRETNAMYAAGVTYGPFDGQTAVGGEDLFVKQWGDATPPAQDIRITWGPFASNATSDSADIVWRTAPAGDSLVRYGTNPGQYDEVMSDAASVTSHLVELYGLNESAVYHFIVESTAAGHTVTSPPSSFQTDPAAGDITISDLFTLGDPMEFCVDVSGMVDRVEFYMNGRLFGTDYSSPFAAKLPSENLNMDLLEMIMVDHTITARAFNSLGAYRTVAAAHTLLQECARTEMHLYIYHPWDGYSIYTDTDAAPPTNLTMDVEAYQAGWFWRTDRFGRFLHMPTNIPVDHVEFYLDSALLHTATDGLPAEPLRFQYTYDLTGLSTGTHSLVARAVSTNHCGIERSADIVVERHLPSVRIETRELYLDETHINVFTMIRNIGEFPVSLDRLVDRVKGFQPTLLDGDGVAEGECRYNPASRQCYVEARFEDGTDLLPGQFVVVRYAAVPVMYSGAVTYQVGGYGYLIYHDAYESSREEMTMISPWVRSGTRDISLRAAVNRMFSASDYLIVTSPANLFGLHDRDSVNELLMEIGNYATVADAVLGYYYAGGFVSVDWAPGDPFAVGDIFYDPGCEVAVGNVDTNLLRVWNRSAEFKLRGVDGAPSRLPTTVELEAGDAIGMGNYLPQDTESGDHWREEICVAFGSGHHGLDVGRVLILSYQHDPAVRDFQVEYLSTSYDDGDGFAMGHVLHTGSGGHEILVANADGSGVIDLYYHLMGASRSLTTSFRAGDGMAVANVLGTDAGEQIVLASAADDRLRLHRTYDASDWGTPRYEVALGFDFTAGDSLVAGNVWGDSLCEILAADESADRVYMYGYRAYTDALEQLGDFRLELGPDDVLAVGQLHPGLHEQILVMRESAGRGSGSGLDIFTYSGGLAPGDRWTLDAWLNRDTGEAWGNRMAPGWFENGVLLLVGETDIIPAFSHNWTLESGAVIASDTTDLDYASTHGDVHSPNLRLGRIVGDTPADLMVPLETSRAVRRRDLRLNESLALLIRGFAMGPSGGSDDIDFSRDMAGVEAGLEGTGFTVGTRDTSDGSGFDANAFFMDARSRDFLFLVAHGNPGGWDIIPGSEVDSRFNPGLCAPVVYASSCSTARYPKGRSLAESFLGRGAAAYIGATGIGRWTWGRELATQFSSHFSDRTDIGTMLKNVRETCAFMGSGNGRCMYQYNCAAFQLFGDPSLAFEHTGPFRGTGEPASPRTIPGPLSLLDVEIPDYVVTSNGVHHYAGIPGGMPVLVLDRPEVPGYQVAVSFPYGYQVQAVTVKQRSGLSTDSGLNLPIVEVLEPGPAANASVSGRNPAQNGWWPETDFEWTLQPAPEEGTVLRIDIHPFFYDHATTDIRFYSNYTFEINYAESDVVISELATDKHVYDPGDTVNVDLGVYNASSQALDVAVEPRIVASGLLKDVIQPWTLRQTRGACSCSFQWDSTGATGGSYAVEVLLRDVQGVVLDRDVANFTLGRAEGRMMVITVTPENFGVGDDVNIRAIFENSGTAPCSGVLVIRVLDALGRQLAIFTRDFEGLMPKGTFVFDVVWHDATVAARGCRILAYAVIDGRATDPLRDTGWENADLFIESIRGSDPGASISWWSVPERVYDVMMSSNLVEESFRCVESNVPPTTPLNVYTDGVDRAGGFYRVTERPAP
ncbi:SBBP repeat-containing protein [Verrucomicrobiota bacterium]